MSEKDEHGSCKDTIVVAISDIHGLHLRDDVLDIPDGDILVVAGDIELRCPRDVAALERWLASLPHRHKVVGFGNMDYAAFGECVSALLEPTRLCPLMLKGAGCAEVGEGLRIAGAIPVVDTVVQVAGQRLLASPWSPKYAGVWQLEDEVAGERHWSRLLPPDLELDVLVTHTPPYGYGDLTRGRHVGDKQLLAAVQALKQPPRLWICGHIHEAVGEYRVPHPAAKAVTDSNAAGGILLVNAAAFYAGVHTGYERCAQPRAVSLSAGRVVAQGDPAKLAARTAAASVGQQQLAGSGGGEVWRAPRSGIAL